MKIADMATASSFLSEDQFLCSICLEVFSEPVSIPCGHNFCKTCISRHWEDKEQCQCPLCNEKFNKGLKLRVNTGFREVVENFKKHCAIADNNFPVKPGQVPCDCCPGNLFKASKTCLVCLTSYCEIHLEPHRRVDALKRHKLTNPVHNLEDKICKKHNRILELLCRDDLTRVCVLCTEHSAHDTVPLDESYVDKSIQILKKKVKVQEMKPKRGKKARKVALQSKGQGKHEANRMGSNQLQAPYIWLFPYDGLRHCNRYFYLPGFLGLSGGRFYYKVEAKEKSSWDLGIVRESILSERTFTPDPRNGSWIIRLENNNICKAFHDGLVHIFLVRKPERVMVFVDYDNGFVSFLDADTAILIYTFTGCKFNESIFLFYSPVEAVSWPQKIRKKVEKIWPQLPYILFGLSLILSVLISIWKS